jgi:hypothetical protein
MEFRILYIENKNFIALVKLRREDTNPNYSSIKISEISKRLNIEFQELINIIKMCSGKIYMLRGDCTCYFTNLKDFDKFNEMMMPYLMMFKITE